MGWGSFIHAISHPIATITKIIKHPVALVTAVLPADVAKPLTSVLTKVFKTVVPVLEDFTSPITNAVGGGNTDVRKIANALATTTAIQQKNTQQLGGLITTEQTTQKILGVETQLIGVAIQRQTKLRKMLVGQFTGMTRLADLEVKELDRGNVLAERNNYLNIALVVLAVVAMVTRPKSF